MYRFMPEAKPRNRFAEQAFESKIGLLLNPEAKINNGYQLSVMREFWSKLGLEMPELSGDQQKTLAKTVNKHSKHRVVPTPLLRQGERKALVEKGRTLPGQQFHADYYALWTPGEDQVYGKLLDEPESVVTNGGKSYVLRYKAPDGQVVSRAAYVASLIENGQAIEAKDGTVWTYPVMNVGVRSQNNRNYVRQLHERVDPIATPDSLIAMQLLHQAAGTLATTWEVDIANEAVYEWDESGNPMDLAGVASVRWRPYYQQVSLSIWFPGFQTAYYGVRDAVSGIAEPNGNAGITD